MSEDVCPEGLLLQKWSGWIFRRGSLLPALMERAHQAF